MSPDVSPSFPSISLPPHQVCRFALHHHQNRLTKIPSISKIHRFPTFPPPPRRNFCRSRLKPPQPPCFLTRSQISYAHSSPIIVFSPCPAIGAPSEPLISPPLAPPPDLLSMTVVLSSPSPTLNTLPLSLLTQLLVLSILLPTLGCGSSDPVLTFKIFLLFSQEFYKLLTCYNKAILCIPCWLIVWWICCFVNVLFYWCYFFVSFVCQVHLLVMLWTCSCWLTIWRPVCSIEIKEEKRIVFLGLNWCYPHDLWFSGRFEMSCFELKWRIDCWLFDWSQLLFPEELALLHYNYPGHLMARDPEVLVSKDSPCITCVTLFVSPMYQSHLLMSQFTGGVVSSSLGFLLDILYYGFSPDFMFNKI